MINAERPGNRDSVFFSSLAQQVWHTDPMRVSKDTWHRVLLGIDYFTDHPDAEFDRQFDKVMSQTQGGETNDYPFTAEGAESILKRLQWQWRYNARTGRAEFKRETDTRFHSLANKEPQLELQGYVRSQFTLSLIHI